MHAVQMDKKWLKITTDMYDKNTDQTLKNT